MSNYTKSTNFATKDNLSPGDPLKIVRGTEIDTEFNNISTAISTKTDNSAAAITGGSITGITDLAIADGGTGASTATGALNNLLPSQTGNSSKYLQTDGTNATWDAISINTGDITGTLPVANGGTGITSFGTGIATFLGTPSSANLASAVTDETGSGALVFANTPTLVAPILGTPTSGNFSSGSFTWPTFNQNTTGTAAGLSATLAIASGGTGQTTANAAFNALAPSQTSASGKYLKSDGTNTSWDALDISTADITGTLPVANGGTGVTSSTGTGNVVLSNSPTLVTPILGTPQSGNFSTGTFTWPTFNQNTTGTAAGLSATLATTSGGTGLTSFTSGGVVYASSSSALATGSALTFDGTALKLGTTSSTNKLLIDTAVSAGNLQLPRGGYIGFSNAADNSNSEYIYANSGNIEVGINATTTLTFTSSSLYTASGINVGIGLSNPAFGLTVEKNNGAGYIAAFRSGTGNPYITLQTTGGITQIQGINSAFTDVNNIAMQISGGNVGIGTSSPATKLEVYHATNSDQYWRTSAVSLYAQANNTNATGIFGTLSNHPLAFYANNAERARIDSSGNLLVGTTSTTINSSNFGFKVQAEGYVGFSRNVGSGSAVSQIYGNAGEFRILGDGNVQNTNNSYGAISDAKLKENIVDASPKLADLMQVQVRNYNLIGDTKKQIGVVAQELETVFPAMIDETTDTDAEGNDLGTTTKSVKYSVFVPMLIKAIQEQQAIIESLKARLDAANL